MKNQIAASLTFLTTGLICGAGIGTRWLPAEGDEPTAPTRLASPLPAATDDESLRVTPVVTAVRRAADSVVSINMIDLRNRDISGQGSGVILDENGLVITNWHVVWLAIGRDERYQLQIRLKDQRQYTAKVLSHSARDDLALLQVDLPDNETVVPMELGDSDSLMIGETVIAIGNPRGHAHSVTSGVLSAEDRSIAVTAPDGERREFEGLLQTDAAINQGNSGGALLDITGKMIGINNAMAVSAENIGFAIPVNTVKRAFRDSLARSVNLSSVWLGMLVDDRGGEVVVSAVEPLGPAARAGIREGDRVVAARTQPVSSELDYARQLLQASPGEQFPLSLRRLGRNVEVDPVPLSQSGFELVRRIGVEVQTVTYEEDPELVRQASLAFYGNQGRRTPALPGVVVIKRIYPDSPAADLKARAGDVLLGFGYRDYFGDYRESPFVSEQNLAERMRMYAGRTLEVIVLREDTDLSGKLRVR